MRLLVLGGSVFLSRAVVEAALARGDEVTTFTRGASGSVPSSARAVVGDRDAESGLRALGGDEWDVVLDVGRSPSQVARAVTELEHRVDRYIFVSTVSVYASYADGPLREESPVADAAAASVDEADASQYGPLKVRCEEIVRRAFGGRALVVRPGLIVGPGDPSDRFTYWVERGGRGGTVLAPGDLARPVRFVDVRDLAEWIHRAAGAGLGGTCNAVGPGPPMPLGELVAQCLHIGGGAGPTEWVTDQFLRDHEVAPYRDMPLWVPDIPEYRYFAQVDTARAVAAGLTFRPVRETVADTLAWARSRTAPTRAAGLSPEREAELLAAWAAESQ